MLLAVVANTRSGGNTDPDRIAQLLTEHGASAQRLRMDDLDGPLPDGVKRLVIAGGDGSIGVAARAAQRAGVPLAVVATGTANDFARALDLPTDVEQACALAADPAATIQHREIGEIGGHPFVNAAAAGLSAIASRRAEPHKSRLGPLAYVWGALQAGLTAQTLDCRVRCDGEECFSGRIWQVVVGVTGAFGGGSALGDTSHDDGELDVAVIPAGARIALVRRAYAMRRGRLTGQSGVHHHRGRVVEIDLSTGAPFNIDGDVRECHPARFTLMPGGVEVVVP